MKKWVKQDYDIIKFCNRCGQGYTVNISGIRVKHDKTNWKDIKRGICWECRQKIKERDKYEGKSN